VVRESGLFATREDDDDDGGGRRRGWVRDALSVIVLYLYDRGARARQSASDDGVNDASGRRRKRRFKRHDKDE